MAPQRIEEVPIKRVAAPGCRLPTRFPLGEILTDITQRQWKIGKLIGHGSFGDIYLASNVLNKPVEDDAKYVIKIEPHNNGPLFVEMNFYIRAAQKHMIESWCKEQKKRRVGIPSYEGSGSHSIHGQKYRFLVLPRYGIDVGKLFLARGRRLDTRMIDALAIQMLDSLEYIHSKGYAHADVKGSNILLNVETKDIANDPKAYLVDYGLAFRFRTRAGTHKPFAHDERRAHEGTLEFTSRDAHHGTHSRRGDLETLGYNLIQWLCGKLPWERKCNGTPIMTPEEIHQEKESLLSDVPLFMHKCFSSEENAPAALMVYMQYVANLSFETRPDYAFLRTLFSQNSWKSSIFRSLSDPIISLKRSRKRACNENMSCKLTKRLCIKNSERKPCVPVNGEMRITRKNFLPSPKVQFSWEEVLAQHPDRMAKLLPIEPPLSPPLTPPPSPPPPAPPTYAMIQVLRRIKERQSGITKPRSSSKTADHDLKPKWMTPAMEAVSGQLRNRLKPLMISPEHQNSQADTSTRLTRSRAALLNRHLDSGESISKQRLKGSSGKLKISQTKKTGRGRII